MANCLLSWPNYVTPQYDPRTNIVPVLLTPTFSGGDWQPTTPLSNFRFGELYYPVRSVNATAAKTIIVSDAQVSRPARVFALIRHNFTPIKGGDANAPTVRVTHGDDPTFAAFSYQSAFVPVYSAMYAPASLPSGWNPAWFTGGPTIEDLMAYASITFVHVADQNYIGRYTRFEIVDTANAAGYVQLALPWVGPGYQPRLNMSYGPTIGAEDPSTKNEGDTGVEFWTERRIRRVATFQLEHIKTDEALELPFEMKMRLGLSKKLFFCMDPASTYHMHRLSFVCRQAQLDPLTNPYFNRYTAPVHLREVL